MNRGKRSLALEGKAPGGKEVLERLLQHADIVLNNYSPRGAASLGVNAAAVLPLNPSAVTIAMTGYGETGPMGPHFSLGPILEAFGGIDEAMGYAGEGPLRLGIAYADAVGGVHGAFATLAALWERRSTGNAVHVDLSQLETLVSIVGDGLLAASTTGRTPPRQGNRSPDHAPQGVYRCAGDDRWLALTVTDDAAWRRLVDLVADEQLAALRDAPLGERFARHDAIDAVLSRWTLDRESAAAARQLQDHGIPACPAFTTRDLVDDAHLAARGFMVEWDQIDVGLARFPGYPVHFEARDVRRRRCSRSRRGQPQRAARARLRRRRDRPSRGRRGDRRPSAALTTLNRSRPTRPSGRATRPAAPRSSSGPCRSGTRPSAPSSRTRG